MALFNIRWPGSGNGSGSRDDDKRGGRQRRATSTESIEALRRRARHRLIGAAVLLVAGVVGFPLLFDTQPRPISVDIPITIPGQDPAPAAIVATPAPAVATAPAVAPANRNPAPAAVSPPASPPAATFASAAATAPVAAAKPGSSRTSTADSLDRGEEVVASVPARADKPTPAPAPATPSRPQSRPAEPAHDSHREVATAPKPTPAPAQVDDDAARARALLEGRPMPSPSAPAATATAAPAAAATGRFVVQVGAFGDAGKAQEARSKLTRSGIATYVQSVDTKDGKRLRVRVGPFASKADADRAAAKVKGLDLPASILNL
ncbi:SPOR domain-containing protein [Xylophilus sp. Kf1]|nr:SPOR domain-containing protein [Xylophilus sp. Kf1]